MFAHGVYGRDAVVDGGPVVIEVTAYVVLTAAGVLGVNTVWRNAEQGDAPRIIRVGQPWRLHLSENYSYPTRPAGWSSQDGPIVCAGIEGDLIEQLLNR
jgi:hypothetical protein